MVWRSIYLTEILHIFRNFESTKRLMILEMSDQKYFVIIVSRLMNGYLKLFQMFKTTFKSSFKCHVWWDTSCLYKCFEQGYILRLILWIRSNVGKDDFYTKFQLSRVSSFIYNLGFEHELSALLQPGPGWPVWSYSDLLSWVQVIRRRRTQVNRWFVFSLIYHLSLAPRIFNLSLNIIWYIANNV